MKSKVFKAAVEKFERDGNKSANESKSDIAKTV